MNLNSTYNRPLCKLFIRFKKYYLGIYVTSMIAARYYPYGHMYESYQVLSLYNNILRDHLANSLSICLPSFLAFRGKWVLRNRHILRRLISGHYVDGLKCISA